MEGAILDARTGARGRTVRVLEVIRSLESDLREDITIEKTGKFRRLKSTEIHITFIEVRKLKGLTEHTRPDRRCLELGY